MFRILVGVLIIFCLVFILSFLGFEGYGEIELFIFVYDHHKARPHDRKNALGIDILFIFIIFYISPVPFYCSFLSFIPAQHYR